jgi:cobalt-zinc-cadmium efflux system membrane fusion protein
MLALVDSMEVGKAKSDLLQMVALSQLRTLSLGRLRAAGQATPFATLEEAESSLRESTIKLNAARQSLVNLGLPMDNINMQGITTEMLENKLHFLGIPAEISGKLDPLQTTRNLLPLVSPIDGIIVSREVVAGEVVDASKILFEVVDNEHKWMTLDVKSEDARFLHLGQKVLFQENQSIKDIVCNLSWVSTQADIKTRTVKARANLNDEGGKMRANTFGTGRIILREEPQALCIPKEAVHWEGCCNVVFVRDANFLNPDAPKFFSVRKVRIGIRDDNQVEILAGLLPGELVVKQGSGLLLSELLKGSLGEGCACHSKK